MKLKRDVSIYTNIRNVKDVKELRKIIRFVNRWIKEGFVDVEKLAVRIDEKARELGYRLIETIRGFKLIKA